MNRKTILYIAASVDGFIAREDGSIDWLDDFEGEGDNGYGDFYQTIDTVILGRSTYEHIKVLVADFPYKDKTCYVLTKTPDRFSDEHVIFIHEDMKDFIQRLKKQRGSNIWIAGGAELAHTLIKEGAIDEFIMTMIPVMLGSGIPLFHQHQTETKLRLTDMRRFGQAAQLHYETT
ncbi:dihydrofolate reductase family protein [Bacillus atrophaeus]|uniref:dihydrofolate reductase family protein n=1 Tax=Bacillus atrophaeus TaxID=1452 RepID=UPI002880A2A6|nr:dihydrofolate reductase family protein [Bacillus atrophaeus]MDS9995763.1 dihydrofolate reductase family protein [Bacillus atrophaeus]